MSAREVENECITGRMRLLSRQFECVDYEARGLYPTDYEHRIYVLSISHLDSFRTQRLAF